MSELWLAFWTLVGIPFRRWLGGGLFECSRIWKLLFLALCVFCMYLTSHQLDFKSWWSWFCMIWAYLWFMRFNNHTHGDYFDVNSEKPDEERSWWVGKVLKKLFGKGQYYNYWGNVVGLMLGYTVPALFASIFMPHHFFWIAGPIVALVYGIMGKLFPNKPFTEYAEWFNGPIMFFIFYANLM